MREPVSSKPDTQVINFPDGNWWQVHTLVTRGMRKAISKAAMESFTLPSDSGVDPMDVEGAQQWLMKNPSYLDINKKDDALLVVGTIDWSWEEPVSIDFIDSLPESYTSQVLVVLDKLFAEVSGNLSQGGVEI
jgi:hypothetical protein